CVQRSNLVHVNSVIRLSSAHVSILRK
ncbi:unnamed protein product, partial [Rotaria sp. Silwood1]